MKKRTIGKIQIALGIFLIIAAIIALIYSNKFLLESYNNTTESIMEKSVEQRQYFQSNETLSIYGLVGMDALFSLSGDYLIGGEIIIAGGVIVIIISVNMILQGLANIGE
jgi:Na+/H+ antiporter NhaA